jgi:glutathione S-transferase
MNPETVNLTRFFKAPREKVFEAFTQSVALVHWFGPRGCTCPSIAVDLRVGGRYRIQMHGEDSGDVFVLTGEYREIVPPEKLVFTWTWAQGDMAGVETVVSVTLKPKPGGTELTLRHAGLPTPRAVQMHTQGWVSSWDCLDDHLAGRGKTPVAQPTLLGDPRSTYVRSARLAFEEKAIAYRLEPHAPNDEVVAALHPFRRIPVYRQGALTLFETSAINCYLYDAMVRRYVLQYVFPRRVNGKPDRAAIDQARIEIAQQLDLLEKTYGERDTLAGGAVTLADLLLAPIVFYLNLFAESKALPAGHQNVKRAHGVIARRPSFAATMPPAS